MSRRSRFEDVDLKHLEFIQSNIARMGTNSFLLKGWSVTLVAAILALSLRAPNGYFVLIALLPGLSFWGLDAFYLAQEKQFRNLYEDTVEGKVEAFALSPPEYQVSIIGWLGALKSRSVIPLHITIVVAVVLISLFIT